MVSRRIFLRNALIVSAGTWAAALGLIGVSRKLRAWFFPRRLPASAMTFLTSLEHGAEAGERVRLRTHERRDLVARTETFFRETAATNGDHAAALRSRIERDFATGRVIAADGWYLADTEAGVYVLQTDIGKGLYRAS